MKHKDIARSESGRAYLKSLGDPYGLTDREKQLSEAFKLRHGLGDYHPDYPG